MKRQVFLILITFLIVSCSQKKVNLPLQVIVTKDSITHQMKEGIGCNLHVLEREPLIDSVRSIAGSLWQANPHLNDTTAWDYIFSNLDWLGFDWIRMAITLRIWEPEKNVFTPDSYEMKLLYRYLDYFQENGTSVFLQHFFHNTKWLTDDEYKNDPFKVVRAAPNDIDAYTDGLIKLLKHLIEVKGYTCIKQIGITNEPFENWSWYIKSFDPDKYASPAPAFKMMSEKLKESELRVQLTGPDISLWEGHYIHPDNSDFFQYFDAIDFHQYLTRFDWIEQEYVYIEDSIKCQLDKISTSLNQVSEWKSYCSKRNIPLLISELGTFMYGFNRTNAGVISYLALLKDIETVIRYTNAGIDGFARWNFLNRGDVDGPWQMINTWDFENNKLLPSDQYSVSPTPYYMWGLLSRYTSGKSFVLKTRVDTDLSDKNHVFACTYKCPNTGNISIYVINTGSKRKACEITINGLYDNDFKLYQLIETNLNANTFKQGENLEAVGDKFKLELEPQSVTLLTNYIH